MKKYCLDNSLCIDDVSKWTLTNIGLPEINNDYFLFYPNNKIEKRIVNHEVFFSIGRLPSVLVPEVRDEILIEQKSNKIILQKDPIYLNDIYSTEVYFFNESINQFIEFIVTANTFLSIVETDKDLDAEKTKERISLLIAKFKLIDSTAVSQQESKVEHKQYWRCWLNQVVSDLGAKHDILFKEFFPYFLSYANY